MWGTTAGAARGHEQDLEATEGKSRNADQASVTEGDSGKDGRAIRDMFAGVAPRYDLLNHLLSGALDFVWRRRAAHELTVAQRRRVLDLCCGTGDQALTLARRGATVAAADFCVPMLALARAKVRPRRHPRKLRPSKRNAGRVALAAADALALPFPENSFSAATVSFGLRNVADLDRALAQLAAGLEPGGKLVILEFALPRRRWLRPLYLFYFRRILPRIGGWLSPRGSAYDYLPSSVLDFPQRADFTGHMERAGLTDCRWRDLSGGIVCLYTGRIPS